MMDEYVFADRNLITGSPHPDAVIVILEIADAVARIDPAHFVDDMPHDAKAKTDRTIRPVVLVTNYLKALSVRDPAFFAIGVAGESDAATIGARIARSIERLQLDGAEVADIEVADIDLAQIDDWVAAIPAQTRLRVSKDERLAGLAFAPDRSPSGIARTVRGEQR